MALKILRMILVLLAVAMIGYYVYDLIVNDTPPTENLLQTIIVVFSCVSGLVKSFSGGGRRRSLSFYENHFAKEITGAFVNSKSDRKKLVKALRLYDEDKLNKAAKSLISLKKKCKHPADAAAVGLFLALTFTDMNFFDGAINEYEQLISMNIKTSTIHSNLGNLYSKCGNTDKAIMNFEEAIYLDPENEYPLHNLASLYFNNYDFDRAIEYDLKALAINSKFRQAASLLTIMYSLRADKENADKYFHIAKIAGEKTEDLNNAIAFYKMKREDDTTGDIK